MIARNKQTAENGLRLSIGRANDEALHVGPPPTISRTNLVPQTRQSGIIK
jgi:hypothetical protein